VSTRDKLREDINYAPYCMCSTMGRMTKTEKGFKCDPLKMDHFRRFGCGHEFEFDEEFLKELESLGWDNAVPEREVTASEMDEILFASKRRYQ
jgi:hypothetical protein